ncbi:MAG: hypothetical protein H7338_04915 [Candidatus Sericytochromatia bacterium]|nr:hypothetical protein [Candidatus Sericytochromatia bacterium]
MNFGRMAAVLALGLLTAVTMPACRASTKPAAVLLYAAGHLENAPDLPADSCPRFTFEGFRNTGMQVDTVVVGGHSIPPIYVGQPAAMVAKAVASFQPKLIILETCYGATTPLLDALAATGLRCWVVAAPYQMPIRNMRYGPDFFTAADPTRRAMAVTTDPPYPLLRWQLDPVALRAVHAKVDAMSPAELRKNLKRVQPTLIKVPLPSKLEPLGRILVPVTAKRFST